MAEVVHGAHIRLNARLGDMAPEGPWETLSKDSQEFVRHRVRLIVRGVSPCELQADWVRWMVRRKWTLGEVKDPIARTHPNLLPLNELEDAQQLKVYLAVAIVREMMKW
jgi:hypothetical protein